jgi:hypothetical protein
MPKIGDLSMLADASTSQLIHETAPFSGKHQIAPSSDGVLQHKRTALMPPNQCRGKGEQILADLSKNIMLMSEYNANVFHDEFGSLVDFPTSLVFLLLLSLLLLLLPAICQ